MKNSLESLQTQHWLMARLGHLGDVLLTTGVLRYFGEAHGLLFDVLTREEWAPVFTGHPFVRSVHALAAQDLAQPRLIAYLRNLATTYTSRPGSPAAGLLDLHGTLRTRLLRLLWQGPVAQYPKMRLQRSFFQASHGRFCGENLRALSVPQRYAMALSNSALTESALLPQLWLTPAEKEEGATLLYSALPLPLSATPVALHPFATHATKAWPVEHWRALAVLLDACHIPWVVIGRGDSPLPHSPLVNNTSLRQSAAVLSHCRALITGDSGPMHLARAVQTPVVGLFGPTTREWGFYPTQPEGCVLEHPLPCRPCSLHGKKPCPRNVQCLREVTPGQVLQAIQRQKNT